MLLVYFFTRYIKLLQMILSYEIIKQTFNYQNVNKNKIDIKTNTYLTFDINLTLSNLDNSTALMF